LRAAADLQAICQERRWKFCFIGGIALMRWGEPRETVDADLTLFVGFGGEDEYVRHLLSRFEARIADAAEFALERRVLLLRARNGVGLDIALAGLPYEQLIIERSTVFEYPGSVFLRTCSAEDLIVLKAFAGRDQDWVDVRKVIIRQWSNLDWHYINRNLGALAEVKGEPQILLDLERIRSIIAKQG
jgi:hypothetical protein